MKKRIVRWMGIVIVFLTAMVLILYPYIANYRFEHQSGNVVETVKRAVADIPDETKVEVINAAKKYNEIIAGGRVQLTDPFLPEYIEEDTDAYLQMLNVSSNGASDANSVMGSVEIPVINVNLPIYHGTSSSVLERGVGHLQGTSLPVGGPSTHTVLTGHTGLSSARLFDDLTEVKKGDVFFLHVMDEDMAYKVDDIHIILPRELDKLQVTQGKDYCTLVTCTPYGVNTHRLLVRGVRTDYKDAVQDPDVFVKRSNSKWMSEYKKALILAGLLFSIAFCVLIVLSKRKMRYRVLDDFR